MDGVMIDMNYIKSNRNMCMHCVCVIFHYYLDAIGQSSRRERHGDLDSAADLDFSVFLVAETELRLEIRRMNRLNRC